MCYTLYNSCVDCGHVFSTKFKLCKMSDAGLVCTTMTVRDYETKLTDATTAMNGGLCMNMRLIMRARTCENKHPDCECHNPLNT